MSKILIGLTLPASCAWAGEFEYQGLLGAYGSSMPEIKRTDITKNDTGLEGQILGKYKFNKNFSFQFQPWFKTDGMTKSNPDKFQYETQELSLEWKKSSRKLKLGVSTAVWEGTDLFNPMDIASVKNYRDPLSIQNRGSAGLFYSDQIGKFSADLVYIPWQTKALMPSQESPWYPRDISLTQSNNQNVVLPTDPTYQVFDDQILNNALANNVGLRLQYHGSSFDLSVAGFDGEAPNPLMIPRIQGVAIGNNPITFQNPVEIYPIYYRQRVAAAAAMFTAGSWIFRLAAQHAQPIGADTYTPTFTNQALNMPSWSDYGVLGIEKNIEWGEQSITVILQGIASHQPQSDSISSFSSLLEKSAMLALRFPFKEGWTWTSAFFQEFKTNGNFFHTELGWGFAEHWRTELSVDVLSGSPASTIGSYDQNDRGTFRMVYSF